MNRRMLLLGVVGVTVLFCTKPLLAQEPTSEDYIQFMKPLVGMWKTTMEIDGKTIPGTMTYRLSPNQQCFLGYYTGGLPDVQTVEGYDPVNKKHTTRGIGRDGSFGSASVDWGTYLRPGKTLGKGVSGKESFQLLSRDGKTLTATSTVTCTTLEKGKVVLEYSNRIEDGKPAPDMKFTMEAMSPRRPEAASSAPALLKEYADAMVGEWECKACVPWGSAPGVDKVPARGTCSWMAGGTALQWNLRVGTGMGQGFTYFDPINKQLKELWVGSDGSCFDLVITKEDGKWVNQATMLLPDGKKSEVRMATTVAKDGNTHVNEYPTHKEVFTRVRR